MEWISIEEVPLDTNRYLFVTKSGIQRVDRFFKGKQIPAVGGIHWNEKPADRYVSWMPLPPPPK